MQPLPVNRQKDVASPARPARGARRALAAAFASFNQTAGALETSYANLRTEVARLRHELEEKNHSLEQSLEENRRMQGYLAGIVAGLPCGVLVFDEEDHLRMMNPAAGHLLDAGVEDPLSATTSSLHPLLGALLATLPAEEFQREQEWVVQGSQSGRTLGVTRAWLQASGHGSDSILILRDLTEAKQLEREREASRRLQALAEVATLLAHEVRNPLGSLELFAGLLADALASQAELQSWTNHIQAGLRSLAATVNNVLQFHSQPEAQLISVDLKRLVGETVGFLHPLARQKRMSIEWKAPGDSMPILSDPPRLQQVFLNLALNAFRAMKPGGKLSIHLRLEEGDSTGAYAADFIDQGTGIREEHLAKIFQPGFSTQTSSPGLGLAVVGKVIEQHGGAVRVTSHVGRGTTFTIIFPRAGP